MVVIQTQAGMFTYHLRCRARADHRRSLPPAADRSTAPGARALGVRDDDAAAKEYSPPQLPKIVTEQPAAAPARVTILTPPLRCRDHRTQQLPAGTGNPLADRESRSDTLGDEITADLSELRSTLHPIGVIRCRNSHHTMGRSSPWS
ncbi:hypothetical protein GCM10012275_45890 [Longimycelium tulufanense]|uniref:Uncharacterized protein n=1 Tax=Longimycelium tulufanense TaxID=907463 RepID=A0A8J3FVN8_9PSEU|nr:hypothetical protein GCM10012275_45890 [Longimycelium tulufanense]